MLLSQLFSPQIALAQTSCTTPGSLCTSGVTYNADSSANISRSSDSAQLPETNLINPTQGWVAVRMKVGFPSTTTLSPDPIIWDMSESDPKDLFVYYDVGTDQFHFARNSGSGGTIHASATQSFSIGDTKTIIAAWTPTQLKISVDGNQFVTTSTSSIPAQAPFLIGSTLVQGSGRQPNSDYYWVAAGTGTLSDTQAAQIHSFANSDHPRADFPGSATFIWWAKSDQYNTDSAAPDQLAAYSFNEGSGTTAFDTSGNSRHAALSNTTWTTGKFSNGLSFNGTSSRTQDSSVTILPYTFMAWINNPTNSSRETIVSVGPNRHFFLANGQVGFYDGTRDDIWSGTIPNNQWHHLAVTYDGTGNLRAYLDGTWMGTTFASPFGAQPSSVTDTIYIGAHPSGSSFNDFFSGIIDEVRIYNRELSSTEIQSVMNTPISGNPLSTPTPTSVPTGSPAPTSSFLPGDADHDGDVDLVDLGLWARDYGLTTSPADFNTDSMVNGVDYLIWRVNFLPSPPSSPTPTSTGPTPTTSIPTPTRTPTPIPTSGPTSTPGPTLPPGTFPNPPPGSTSDCGGLWCAESPPYLVNGQVAFDQRRIPIELQGWWMPSYGHVHWAANVPLGQQVTGTMNFNIRIVMHDNPSTLSTVEVYDESHTRRYVSTNTRCPYDGSISTNCAFNFDVNFDTNSLSNQWHEFRLRSVSHTLDGKEFLNSSAVPFQVANGSTSDTAHADAVTGQMLCNNPGPGSTRYSSFSGRGWYTDAGYTVAVIDCVPLRPLSKSAYPSGYTFRARASQETSSKLTIAMDKSHAIPATGTWPQVQARAGLVLLAQPGNITSLQPVLIDLNKLQNGWHSIAATSDDSETHLTTCNIPLICGPSGIQNRASGVAKVWFFVTN
ncbi:hypothetical protein A2989_02955 [Candidatus Amesbacteria bacterium RIFCSPLOWO2_01_FULL_48_25]|uniref:LamG-like jellyroll fold domain-containing protein n=1 Tax=Candidatus Amesbacteria bacterium RIFCSPLOWO2_01_FULL_48_25 TaxID=1797259 RepID=A0A1F4ZBP5_9BACT|nr:MAG: hypothetical protein A2989_02955 [Candidatus Amesbacteria bacterium RIFCSPLOWO2_01_FULL_48_25]